MQRLESAGADGMRRRGWTMCPVGGDDVRREWGRRASELVAREVARELRVQHTPRVGTTVAPGADCGCRVRRWTAGRLDGGVGDTTGSSTASRSHHRITVLEGRAPVTPRAASSLHHASRADAGPGPVVAPPLPHALLRACADPRASALRAATPGTPAPRAPDRQDLPGKHLCPVSTCPAITCSTRARSERTCSASISLEHLSPRSRLHER